MLSGAGTNAGKIIVTGHTNNAASATNYDGSLGFYGKKGTFTNKVSGLINTIVSPRGVRRRLGGHSQPTAQTRRKISGRQRLLAGDACRRRVPGGNRHHHRHLCRKQIRMQLPH